MLKSTWNVVAVGADGTAATETVNGTKADAYTRVLVLRRRYENAGLGVVLAGYVEAGEQDERGFRSVD